MSFESVPRWNKSLSKWRFENETKITFFAFYIYINYPKKESSNNCALALKKRKFKKELEFCSVLRWNCFKRIKTSPRCLCVRQYTNANLMWVPRQGFRPAHFQVGVGVPIGPRHYFFLAVCFRLFPLRLARTTLLAAVSSHTN